jgi:hypothetical protein
VPGWSKCVRLESLTYGIKKYVRLESLTYGIKKCVRLESLTYGIKEKADEQARRLADAGTDTGPRAQDTDG